MENVRETDIFKTIGKTIVDVTQDDWEDVLRKYPDEEDRCSFMYIHFSDGTTIAIEITQTAFTFIYPYENDCDEPDEQNPEHAPG